MQLSLLPRTLFLLAICILQGTCSMFFVRPLFFHHDNFQQNPVISGWRGSSSILDLAQPKVAPSPDLPDSFSPNIKRQFPIAAHRWTYSRYPPF